MAQRARRQGERHAGIHPPLTKKNTLRSPTHSRISAPAWAPGGADSNLSGSRRRGRESWRGIPCRGRYGPPRGGTAGRRVSVGGPQWPPWRTSRCGRVPKSPRENAYHIAVAHPDLLPAPEPGEQRVGGFVELQRGQAILAFLALTNLAAEQVRHELLSVTDSHYGLSLGEDAGIHRGAAGVVNARRAAGDDDAPSQRRLPQPGSHWPHFGVDPEIADFSRDQMTVLPAPRPGPRSVVWDSNFDG